MRQLPALLTLATVASSLAVVPHPFSSGKTAVAQDVNENFSALDTAIQNRATQASVEAVHTALKGKADQATVDTKLAAKADQGGLNSLASKQKADSATLAKATVDSASQVRKAIPAAVDIGGKADLKWVRDTLRTKVDTAAMASKADTLSVKTQISEALSQVTHGGSMDQGDFNVTPTTSWMGSIFTNQNAPFSATPLNWYNLISVRHRNGGGDGFTYGGQIAWGMTGWASQLAFRSQTNIPTNGGWTTWTEVASKDWVNSNFSVKTASARSPFLPLAGGTISGDLRISGKLTTTPGATPADYVFEPGYNLSSLAEVESFTKANKHLPEIPSAAEMNANGVDLAAMNMLLLKKVEELTLHAIALQKDMESQKQQLEERLRRLESRER